MRSLTFPAALSVVLTASLYAAEETAESAAPAPDLAVWFELDSGTFRSGYLVSFAADLWEITVAGESESIRGADVSRVGFGDRPDWYKKAEPAAADAQPEPVPAEAAPPPERDRKHPGERRPGPLHREGERNDERRRPGMRPRKDGMDESTQRRLDELRKLRDPEAREKELGKIETALKNADDPRTSGRLTIMLYSAYRISGIPAEKTRIRIQGAIAGMKNAQARSAAEGALRRIKMMEERRRRFGAGGGRMPEKPR